MHAHTALGLTLLGLLTAVILPRPATLAATPAGNLPASCAQLVQNGGFESGIAGWHAFSAQGYELVSGFNPHTGELGAYLGGVNDADDRLSQELALPAGSTLTLDAWWYLTTAETADVFDTLTVALLRSDGTVLATAATLDNTAPVGQWNLLTLDLTPYAGQNVTLRFSARTDLSNVTDFYLDDIDLWACAPDATATPTVSATATPSRTPSPSPTASPTPAATGFANAKVYLPLLQR